MGEPAKFTGSSQVHRLIICYEFSTRYRYILMEASRWREKIKLK
jgi:hypothetical protein